MRQYGFNQATDTTRKQIGVIYSLAKRGLLKVEKWAMSELYDHADYYGYDDNASVAYDEQTYVKPLLEAVFSGDYEKAQELIDYRQAGLQTNYGRKFVENADRTIIC